MAELEHMDDMQQIIDNKRQTVTGETHFFPFILSRLGGIAVLSQSTPHLMETRAVGRLGSIKTTDA